MGRLNAPTLAAMALLAGSGSASAADMLMSPPMMPPVARIATAPEFSGWYLRGDIGMGAESTSTWSMSPNRLTPGGPTYVPTTYAQSSAHVSSPVFVGFGVGYQFNDWLRADATLEYRGGARFSSDAQLQFQDQTTNPVTTTTLRTFNRGDLSSVVGLLNGYVDLGTWSGVTPYIGVGIGAARNKVSGLVDQGFYTTSAGGGGSSGGYYADSSKLSFAWALMAGLGYTVTPRTRLEIGYRYLDTGKASSGSLTCYSVGSNCGATHLMVQKNVSQDIKIGMRWLIDEPRTVAYEPAAPLVRKY